VHSRVIAVLYRKAPESVKEEIRRECQTLQIAFPDELLYSECMARLISTTVRLEEEDVRALKRARAAGHSASELIRKGLRVVASRYYTGRRAPSSRLFESTNTKLGDESELFRDLEG
jgi:Arc/MetJ-type ribon-helix-helix transcriptional regulator